MPFRPNYLRVQNRKLLVILLSIFLRMSFYLSSWDLRIIAGPVICDGGFRRDHKACSAEQWPSTCQIAALCCGAEAEACGFLCLSGWAGLRFYECVQSSMKVIWHDFLFTCHPGGKVLDLRGRRRKQPKKSNGAGLAGVKTSTVQGSIRDDR